MVCVGEGQTETMPKVQSPEHHPSCLFESGMNAAPVGMCEAVVFGPYHCVSKGHGDGKLMQSSYLHATSRRCHTIHMNSTQHRQW